MKKYRWLIGLLIILIAAIGYFYLKPKIEAKNIEYTYTSLFQGDIEASVSSTGTLEAINTVDVGTQISGTIAKIYVDFNDKVRQGQPLAEMDMRMLQARLQSAKADLAVSESRLNQAEDQYKRNKILFEKNVISEQEYNNLKYNYQRLPAGQKQQGSCTCCADKRPDQYRLRKNNLSY